MVTILNSKMESNSTASHLAVAAVASTAAALATYALCFYHRRGSGSGSSSRAEPSVQLLKPSSNPGECSKLDDHNVYQLSKDEFDLIPASRGRADHADPAPRSG